jgi:spermidine/putrescine transport system substrate-binding protein
MCTHTLERWREVVDLAPIDVTRIRNRDSVFQGLKDIPGAIDGAGQRTWVPWLWGFTSVAYRTDLAPEYVGNETWNILWDPKYAGRVAMFDNENGHLIPGIVAGVEDPFDFSNPATMAAVEAKLRELVPNLRTWVSSLTVVEQGLASGEIVAASSWGGAVNNLRRAGRTDVAFMRPAEGPLTWGCGPAIVKGTPHEDKIHDMLSAFYELEGQIWQLRNAGYGPSRPDAIEALTGEERTALGLEQDPSAALASGHFLRPIRNQQAIQTLFEEIRSGL